MGLVLPCYQMSALQNNLGASASTGAVAGATVAAHATINTKGSWVECITSTNFDVHGISLTITFDSTAAAQVANLYDIGVGGAGSEVAVIANMLNTGSTSVQNGFNNYFFPIYIPKGTRISARKQSNISAKTSFVHVFLHGGFNSPPWKSFVGADGIGINLADSGGTTLTPVLGSFSSWINIGSTLGRNYRAIMPIVATGSDTTVNSNEGYLDIGISSTTLATYVFVTHNSEAITSIIPNQPIYGNFPAGTQMMMRALVAATADELEFALLGFY